MNFLRKDKPYIDPQFGEFALEKLLYKGYKQCYEKEFDFACGKVLVSLRTKECIKTFRLLYDDIDNFFEKASLFATEQLIDLANYEWGYFPWRDENPNASDDDYIKLTKEDFAKKIKLLYLDIRENNEYYLEYDDGNIFSGHRIHVSGNLEMGFIEANI